MAYYHDLITEKSWIKLQELRKQYSFVLIGGWAVYLYTKGLKSRDIDFICGYEELEKLKNDYDLIKNNRLRKYEIHIGEFDIDIYVPFFSNLGIPVEDLQNMVESHEGFRVLCPESLLILKQKAYEDRGHSAKGRKDFIDIVSLLKNGVDFKKYINLLKQYSLAKYSQNLINMLKSCREVPEIGLGAHTYSQLKNEVMNSF